MCTSKLYKGQSHYILCTCSYTGKLHYLSCSIICEHYSSHASGGKKGQNYEHENQFHQNLPNLKSSSEFLRFKTKKTGY